MSQDRGTRRARLLRLAAVPRTSFFVLTCRGGGSDWPNQPTNFAERHAPPGLTSRPKSALMPRDPTVVLVGAPRNVGCLGDRRDFLNFLKHNMLMETGKNKYLRRQTGHTAVCHSTSVTTPCTKMTTARRQYSKKVHSFLTLDKENPQHLTIHDFIIDIYYSRMDVRQGTHDD
jgi:hypothetical protein